jgi:predicted RNA-binding Zn-ribbon protein involved in translation (DUF1610 family)
MPDLPVTRFECPNCAAKYDVVRVEAPREPITDREITCLSCGGALHGREGLFLLKYFLIERPSGALAGARGLTRPNQRKSKARSSRSFPVQALPLLTFAALMRIREPKGVRVAEFSSI